MKLKTLALTEVFDIIRSDRIRGLEILYTQDFNKMFGIAFSVVKNETDSYDVVHNVMCKFANLELEKFPTKCENSWLYKVIKNEALHLIKKTKRYVLSDSNIWKELEDKSIDDYIDMEEFYSMIKSLNEAQKEIVSLKILCGFSHKEIAVLLGKPIGTIQWQYNLSIKKLRIVLSSMLTAIAILMIGLIARIVYIFSVTNSPNQDGNQFVGKPTFDYLLLVMVIAIVSLIIAFFIFFKKSENFPTKATRKSI